jgi:carboxyl-terminal processing protease
VKRLFLVTGLFAIVLAFAAAGILVFNGHQARDQVPQPTAVAIEEGPPASLQFQDAVAEAVRGMHLLQDTHIDFPITNTLIRGGLERATAAARSVTREAPEVAASGGTDAEVAAALNALIDAAGAPAGNDVIYAFLSGMARSLRDNHTTFLTPDTWRDHAANQVAYTGFGATPTTGGSLIWRVDPGSPADVAGLRPGDTVLSVNGISLTGGSGERPPPAVIGSAASLKVRRAEGGEHTVELTPAALTSAVQSALLPGGIAYLRILGFVPPETRESYLDDLDTHMQTLSARLPIAWIIDLRSNGGGVVQLAASTAARLGYSGRFAEGTMRDGKPINFNAPARELRRVGPLVVLINSRTGSAAELLAAVLRDAGLARIVGERSAGAVRLSNYFEVAGGAFQITVADVRGGPTRRYLEGSGVSPDVAVSLDVRELSRGRDAQLERAIALVAGD